MSPAALSIVISPVAAMSGIGRPIVLADTEPFEPSLQPGATCVAVEADGIIRATIGQGDRVTVRVQRSAGLVVRLDARRHAQVGGVKLSLLDLPLQPGQLLEVIPPELRPALTPQQRAASPRHLTKASPAALGPDPLAKG